MLGPGEYGVRLPGCVGTHPWRHPPDAPRQRGERIEEGRDHKPGPLVTATCKLRHRRQEFLVFLR